MARRIETTEEENSERKELLEKLGQRIKYLRTTRGMSQRAFADAIGVTQSYIYLLEAGGPNITIITLAKIADILGVTIGALFQGTETENETVDPVVTGVVIELRKLGAALDARSKRDSEIVSEIERRLQDFAEATSRMTHKNDGRSKRKT